MIQEEKAKLYDGAGGAFYKKSNEPKESEDERIMKNCIHFLELQKSHHASTVEIEECIDWIKKQGHKETTWNKEDEENMNNVLYILNQPKNTSSCEEDDIVEKTINWFKSLKDRLCSSNEYDKDMLGAIAYCIKNNRPLEKEHIDWLEKKGDYNGLVEKAKAHNEAHLQDVRERAAIAAMQSLIRKKYDTSNGYLFSQSIASEAREYADALIEQLKEN